MALTEPGAWGLLAGACLGLVPAIYAVTAKKIGWGAAAFGLTAAAGLLGGMWVAFGLIVVACGVLYFLLRRPHDLVLDTTESVRACPHCKKLILYRLQVCPHCEKEIPVRVEIPY